ncbi:MAG: hypothetical protein AABX13_01885, partial [Nanoarchaeota archaeon]
MARITHFGLFITIVALMALLLLSSALAAVEIVEQQVTVNADYSVFRDNTNTLSQTIPITLHNTDTANPATVQVSVTGLPAGYPTPSTLTQTVNANSTVTVQISLTIPHAQSSGNTSIGTITASVSGTQQDTTPLLQQTKSMLQYDEVTVEYTDKDGNEQSDDFSSGDTQFKLRDEVRPGTEVTVTLRLENLFDRDYDEGTLESMELTWEVDDDDLYKTDVDEDYDLDDIDGEKTRELALTFTVDDAADEKEYEFTIKAEGEDGLNKIHRLEKKMLLKVERAKNDLRITKAIISPASSEAVTNCAGSSSSPSASPSTASLQVELKNFGSKDQSSAALAVFNQQLGLNQQFSNLVIDEFDDDDNAVTKTVSLPVAGKTAGTYQLEILAFIRGDEEMDSKKVDLVVKDCPQVSVSAAASTAASSASESTTSPAPESATEEVTQEVSTLTAPVQEQTAPALPPAAATPLSSAVVVETVENPYSQTDFLIGMTLVAIAIVVGLIVVFLVILIK